MCILVRNLKVGSVLTQFESSRFRTFMNPISSWCDRSQPLKTSVRTDLELLPELEQVHLIAIQPDLTLSGQSSTLDRVSTRPKPITANASPEPRLNRRIRRISSHFVRRYWFNLQEHGELRCKQ
jgi:hypothetical protein